MKPYPVEANEEWNLPSQEANALRVSTPCGDIRVVGTESDQIDVRVLKHVRAAREEEARAFLPLMRIERRLDGDRWVIEAAWPEARHHGVESPQARFELRVPNRLAVEAESGHGAIDVSDVSEARLRTGSGDLRGRGIRGTLESRTGHGSTRVDGCGSLAAEAGSGDIEVRRSTGAVKATTGHGALRVEECTGPAELSSRSGDIRGRAIHGPVEATSGHGRIEVMGAPEARLRTGSGDIHARLVSGPLEARTGHGRIAVEECEGPATAEASSGDIVIEQVKSEVRASTGHGSLRAGNVGAASLRSNSGDVQVVRAAGPVTTRTGHGQICLDACSDTVEAETRSGGIEIREAGGAVRAQTGHGAIAVTLSPDAGVSQVELGACGPIQLSLPRTVSARLEAHTNSGVIESNPIQGAHLDPRRGHLEAVLGSGEGSIRLRTSHGGIRIRLTEGADVPRTPTPTAV